MKNYILLLFGLFIAIPSFAQLELGIKAGGAFYFGDISANNARSIHNAKESFGLQARYHFKSNLSVQASFNYAQIIGTDAYDAKTSRARNLSVNTFINEFSLMPEYSFLNVKIGEQGKFSMYAATGISVFHFTPTTYYKRSAYIDLQSIGTEGQGITGYDAPYSKVALAIPMSLGTKLAINDFISFEWTILNNRYTFTDYLDDVSTVYPDLDQLRSEKGQRALDLSTRGTNKKTGQNRGNSDTNDWFGTTTFGINFNIGAISMKKKGK
ncbi:MAG: DUF6089 family protein [Saprospiraceae bacterium]